MTNSLLFWLEDRQETISNAKQIVKKLGFQPIIFPVFDDFAAELESYKKQNRLSEITGIIIDVMLYGVEDLEPVVQEHYPTDGGMEAGLVIVEHYLRVLERGFNNLPILVFSARLLNSDAKKNLEIINEKGGAKIKYLEKTPGWENELNRWLNSIKPIEIITTKSY